jgi:integrase
MQHRLQITARCYGLRHTATSMLKNAGVPEAVAMDIIGHDSEVISRHYTHIESKAKRAALRKLPDLD